MSNFSKAIFSNDIEAVKELTNQKLSITFDDIKNAINGNHLEIAKILINNATEDALSGGDKTVLGVTFNKALLNLKYIDSLAVVGTESSILQRLDENEIKKIAFEISQVYINRGEEIFIDNVKTALQISEELTLMLIDNVELQDFKLTRSNKRDISYIKTQAKSKGFEEVMKRIDTKIKEAKLLPKNVSSKSNIDESPVDVIKKINYADLKIDEVINLLNENDDLTKNQILKQINNDVRKDLAKNCNDDIFDMICEIDQQNDISENNTEVKYLGSDE